MTAVACEREVLPGTRALLAHHATLISASAISPEVAAARGYFSAIERAEVGSLGFAAYQCRVPALVVPVHGVAGGVVTHQIRPDLPRGCRGKAVKYETPSGGRLVLDVPPGARAALADPKQPLVIAEGARKADAAVSKGLACVALMGVWGWKGTNPQGGKTALGDWEAIALNGRQVYVVFDSDVTRKEAVRKAQQQLARFLSARGAKPVVIDLPDGPDGAKQGLDDFFAAGRTVEDLFALAPTPAGRRSAAPPASAAQSSKAREIISSVQRVRETVDAAEAALAAYERVPVYQRAGLLVRIVRREVKDGADERPELIRRAEGAPRILQLAQPALVEALSDAAAWFDMRPTKDGFDKHPILPPRWAVDALAARAQWSLPSLAGVVEAPIMRPDGTVLDRPGYDARTGLLFAPSIGFEPVPEEPTIEDARRARDELFEPLAQFPFVGPVDRAAALAAVLTPLVRPALCGNAPLFLVSATTAGTGKGLFVSVVATIATGRSAACWTQPREDDEERKRLLSILLEGDSVVHLDNLTRPLGSDSLDSVLTADVFKDRLLGENRVVAAPTGATTWLASGNNAQVKGDLARRVIPIRMDAGVERPEARTGFQHADLLEYVRGHRPRLVRAALTLLRAYQVEAAERPDIQPMGSFEAWSRMVREPLVWIGEADPLDGQNAIREQADPELESIRLVLIAWYAAFKSVERSLAEAVHEATKGSGGDGNAELRSALAALDPRGNPDRPDAVRLGYRFRQHRGRIVDGLRLVGRDSRHGIRWSVQATAGEVQ